METNPIQLPAVPQFVHHKNLEGIRRHLHHIDMEEGSLAGR